MQLDAKVLAASMGRKICCQNALGPMRFEKPTVFGTANPYFDRTSVALGKLAFSLGVNSATVPE